MKKILATLCVVSLLFLFSSCRKKETPALQETPRQIPAEIQPAVPEYRWEIVISEQMSKDLGYAGITVDYGVELNLQKSVGETAQGSYTGSFEIRYSIDAGQASSLLFLLGISADQLEGYGKNNAMAAEILAFEEDAVTKAVAGTLRTPAMALELCAGAAGVAAATGIPFTESELGVLGDASVQKKLSGLGEANAAEMAGFFSMFGEEGMEAPYTLALFEDGRAELCIYLSDKIILTFEGTLTRQTLLPDAD